MADEALRTACFSALDVLRAIHGDDIPYRGGLEEGFTFQGGKVPFLTPYKGIYRSARQQGKAALSINTSFETPYADEVVPDGFFYAYRDGSIEQPDNRALLAAYVEGVPLAYFVAVRPGRYRAIYPTFVTADDRPTRRVLVTPGKRIGPLDELEPVVIDSPIEREYVVRETAVRLHQGRFRGKMLVAYSTRCTICRLKEERLLDAAHIIGDKEERGEPLVSNGLLLCSIHHRAFDQQLLGISPDYTAHVSPRLLDDEDGPMLELLKTFDQSQIVVPSKTQWKPDKERLAARFELFQAAN